MKASDLVKELCPGFVESPDAFLEGLIERRRAAHEELEAKATPPLVVEDYRPLAESLESQLADLYWSTVGVQAFAGNEVPFIVNNDGQLSADAAAVFFAHCKETAPGRGRLQILELGAGTGLFALYFLDALRSLCQRGATDYYDRLTYYVSDGSPKTVDQWQESGQFTEHAGHVIIGHCDARRPTTLQSPDGKTHPLSHLQAVFTNYVLDVLPAAVVRRASGVAEQLCVRTLLDEPDEVSRTNPRLTADAIQMLASSKDPSARAQLLPILSNLRFETAFVPIGLDAPPFLAEALAFGSDMPRVLLNFGALTSLRACLDLLAPAGFIQINDYGPTNPNEVARFGTATRFGSSIAMGVNFPLLEHTLISACEIVSPPGDADRSIHARLLLKGPAPRASQTFRNEYGKNRWFWESTEPTLIDKARKCAAAGKPVEALEFFRQAMDGNSNNWCLLGEVAEYFIRQSEPAEGARLAGLALRRNPWYSSWLWNTLGDAFFMANQQAEAQCAYEQAARVNPNDVAANFNLSFTLCHAGRYHDALDALAKALIHDFQGEYRERIQEQQQTIMRALSQRWMMHQVRTYQRAAVFE